MAFNATFNNIAVISWQLVLLVDETGVPGENHRAGHRNTLTNFITQCLFVGETGGNHRRVESH
jgi:hypothetical protein